MSEVSKLKAELSRLKNEEAVRADMHAYAAERNKLKAEIWARKNPKLAGLKAKFGSWVQKEMTSKPKGRARTGLGINPGLFKQPKIKLPRFSYG